MMDEFSIKLSDIATLDILSWILDEKSRSDYCIDIFKDQNLCNDRFRKNVHGIVECPEYLEDTKRTEFSRKRSRNSGKPTPKSNDAKTNKISISTNKTIQCNTAKLSSILTDIGSKQVIDNKIISMDQNIHPLIDSMPLFINNDLEGIYKTYQKHGYLYFHNMIQKDIIVNIQHSIQNSLQKMGHVAEDGTSTSPHGWTIDTQRGSIISGYNDFTDNIDEKDRIKWKNLCDQCNLKDITDHESLKKVLSMLCRKKSEVDCLKWQPMTFDPLYTWLRLKAKGESTVEHADLFYFK
eukprot:gene15016-31864_t